MRIEKVVGELYGEPCWNVKPGLGSFLTLEFGKPRLEFREPVITSKGASLRVREHLARRGVQIHGEWHLWIYCCNWEVSSGRKRIGDSSTKQKVRLAAEFLNGQKLMRFSISTRKADCVFKFDLGATLKTRPYDSESVQWLLFEPSCKVLSVRADGYYSYVPSGVPEGREEWKPKKGIESSFLRDRRRNNPR
jgi:hypothetical protein